MDYGNGLTFNYSVPEDVITLIKTKFSKHWNKEPTDEQLANLANDAAFAQFCDECSDDSRYWPSSQYGIGTALLKYVDETSFADYGFPIKKEYSRGMNVSRKVSKYLTDAVARLNELVNHSHIGLTTIDDFINREGEYAEQYKAAVEAEEERLAVEKEDLALRVSRREAFHQEVKRAADELRSTVTAQHLEALQKVMARVKLPVKITGFEEFTINGRDEDGQIILVNTFRKEVEAQIARDAKKAATLEANSKASVGLTTKVEVKPSEVGVQLNGWDLNFFTSCVVVKRLTASSASPKQLLYLDKICQKVLGVRFAEVKWLTS